MRRLGVAAAVVGVALIGAPAGAQLEVGGSVPSLIALAVGTPTGFARHNGSGVYELRVPVEVTSTGESVRLSVADGEDLSGRARGRLRIGSKLAASPLQVAAGGGAPQPLSRPVDPLLQTWHKSLTLAATTIAVSQSLAHGSIGAERVHKVVLITVSSQTP